VVTGPSGGMAEGGWVPCQKRPSCLPNDPSRGPRSQDRRSVTPAGMLHDGDPRISSSAHNTDGVPDIGDQPGGLEHGQVSPPRLVLGQPDDEPRRLWVGQASHLGDVVLMPVPMDDEAGPHRLHHRAQMPPAGRCRRTDLWRDLPWQPSTHHRRFGRSVVRDQDVCRSVPDAALHIAFDDPLLGPLGDPWGSPLPIDGACATAGEKPLTRPGPAKAAGEVEDTRSHPA
jgi:hypothetical protein